MCHSHNPQCGFRELGFVFATFWSYNLQPTIRAAGANFFFLIIVVCHTCNPQPEIAYCGKVFTLRCVLCSATYKPHCVLQIVECFGCLFSLFSLQPTTCILDCRMHIIFIFTDFFYSFELVFIISVSSIISMVKLTCYISHSPSTFGIHCIMIYFIGFWRF